MCGFFPLLLLSFLFQSYRITRSVELPSLSPPGATTIPPPPPIEIGHISPPLKRRQGRGGEGRKNLIRTQTSKISLKSPRNTERKHGPLFSPSLPLSSSSKLNHSSPSSSPFAVRFHLSPPRPTHKYFALIRGRGGKEEKEKVFTTPSSSLLFLPVWPIPFLPLPPLPLTPPPRRRESPSRQAGPVRAYSNSRLLWCLNKVFLANRSLQKLTMLINPKNP